MQPWPRLHSPDGRGKRERWSEKLDPFRALICCQNQADDVRRPVKGKTARGELSSDPAMESWTLQTHPAPGSLLGDSVSCSPACATANAKRRAVALGFLGFDFRTLTLRGPSAGLERAAAVLPDRTRISTDG